MICRGRSIISGCEESGAERQKKRSKWATNRERSPQNSTQLTILEMMLRLLPCVRTDFHEQPHRVTSMAVGSLLRCELIKHFLHIYTHKFRHVSLGICRQFYILTDDDCNLILSFTEDV